jgi:hypothetical protein
MIYRWHLTEGERCLCASCHKELLPNEGVEWVNIDNDPSIMSTKAVHVDCLQPARVARLLQQ